ncbi:MAG TPA: hypothetical protein VGQ37_07365 [Vicinamibacterales bacterium]|nr:hypothetical protein [Vicinamibacterales bacterium]
MATAFAVSSARAQAPTPDGAEGSAPDTRQPQWTARPLFSETEVYVLPKGATALVFDLRPTTSASGPTVTRSAYRAEFGLPVRFQLGLHATGRTTGRQDGRIGNIDAQALEMRWAVADWGRAFGNPTIQAGWTEASRGPDIGELKLLLGGGIGPAWHWGSNVAWTQEASGERAVDRAWSAGVSYAAGRFASVGVETRLALVDRLAADGRSRTSMTRELLAGPSLQIRPARRLYLDVAALFGTTTAAPRSRMALIAGWEF